MPAKVVLKFFMVSSPSAGWPTAFFTESAELFEVADESELALPVDAAWEVLRLL